MKKQPQTQDKNWSKKVKQRDGFVCRRCGCDTFLHAHHILPKGKVKRKYSALAETLENGVTLCGNCHSLVKDREFHTDLRRFLPYDPKIDNQLKELTKKVMSLDVKIPSNLLQCLQAAPRSEYRQNGYAAAWCKRMIRHYENREYQHCINAADKALLKTKKPFAVYLYRGKAKLLTNPSQYLKALYDFNHAICIKPDSSNLYRLRAIAKLGLGQDDDADADLKMSEWILAGKQKERETQNTAKHQTIAEIENLS